MSTVATGVGWVLRVPDERWASASAADLGVRISGFGTLGPLEGGLVGG